MSPQSTRLLGGFAGVLAIIVVVLNFANRNAEPEDERLLPTLQNELNELRRVEIRHGGDSVTIARDGDNWVVRDQDDYPADAGKLSKAMRALAESRRLEAKTVRPDRHAQLGLAGDDDSTFLELGGATADRFTPVSLLLGKTAQGGHRYARLTDDPQAWLIDSNPTLPADATAWLQKNILDIPLSLVATVVIEHADGETIRIARDAEDVLVADNIPDGRELSTTNVLNSIVSSLQNLTLEAVQRADSNTAADLTSTFVTRNGLAIRVQRYSIGDKYWFGFSAMDSTPDPLTVDELKIPAKGSPSASTDDTATESATNVTSNEDADADGTSSQTSREPTAESINSRLAGWWYELPSHKASSISRRWADLLKADDEPDE